MEMTTSTTETTKPKSSPRPSAASASPSPSPTRSRSLSPSPPPPSLPPPRTYHPKTTTSTTTTTMNFPTNSTSPPDVTYKTAENLNVGAQASIRRIARHPDSMIRFAEYDPATATGDPTGAYAFRNLSLNEELCRPKRVVIEFMPNGGCTWRYVPNALWEDNVENEGTWPRVVDVCGYVF